MDYSPEEFAVLEAKVNAAGGMLLSDADGHPFKCSPETIYSERGAYRTTSCGEEALFILPQPAGKDEDGNKIEAGEPFTACACCDDVGAWPRFLEPLDTDDAELEPA